MLYQLRTILTEHEQVIINNMRYPSIRTEMSCTKARLSEW